MKLNKKIKLTIGNKLLGGFIGVSLLVLIAGLVGIFMVGKVVTSAETVVDEKMPLIDASMEALIAVETGISTSRSYVINRSGLDGIKKEIDKSSGTFKEHISAVIEGTEGEARKLAEQAVKEHGLITGARNDGL